MAAITEPVFARVGHDAPDYARLIAEREDAIAALRSMCEDYGDNEWAETLSLADIIEKHLRPNVDYIDSLARNR